MRQSTTASDGYTYDFTPATAGRFLRENAREVAGVLRYISNDSVPPFGILEIAGITGKLMERCEAARDRDSAEFARKYKAQEERFWNDPEFCRCARRARIRDARGVWRG